MTQYYKDKYEDLGISTINKTILIDKKKIWNTLNENYVTTLSNIISWIIGIITVLFMLF